MKTGRAVVVSCNLPANSPMLLARSLLALAPLLRLLPRDGNADATALAQAVAEKYVAKLLQATPRAE
jgi:hypothetical protein